MNFQKMYISLVLGCVGLFLIIVTVVIIVLFLNHSNQAMNDDESEKPKYHSQLHSLSGCVDGASIITLDKNVDARAKLCQRHALSAGIQADLMVVKKHPKGGIYGCMDSHQKLAHTALAKGFSTFLFLEDDARIGSMIPHGLGDEIKQVLSFQKPTAVYLGYLIFAHMGKQVTKHIYEIPNNSNITMMHAVAMNEACMRIVLTLENTGKPGNEYDQIIRKDSRIKKFVVYPMIFHQCACGTDIGETDAYFANAAERSLGVVRTTRILSFLSYNNAIIPLLITGAIAVVASIPLFVFEKSRRKK